MYIIFKNYEEIGRTDDRVNAWRILEREFDGVDDESDEITVLQILDTKTFEIVVDLRVRHF